MVSNSQFDDWVYNTQRPYTQQACWSVAPTRSVGSSTNSPSSDPLQHASRVLAGWIDHAVTIRQMGGQR